MRFDIDAVGEAELGAEALLFAGFGAAELDGFGAGDGPGDAGGDVLPKLVVGFEAGLHAEGGATDVPIDRAGPWRAKGHAPVLGEHDGADADEANGF